jgi:hypothetical protein
MREGVFFDLMSWRAEPWQSTMIPQRVGGDHSEAVFGSAPVANIHHALTPIGVRLEQDGLQ